MDIAVVSCRENREARLHYSSCSQDWFLGRRMGVTVDLGEGQQGPKVGTLIQQNLLVTV